MPFDDVQYSEFQVSPNCVYLQKTVYFEIGSEKFSCSGKAVVDLGFTAIMPWLQIQDDEEIPPLKQDDKLAVDEVCTMLIVYII